MKMRLIIANTSSSVNSITSPPLIGKAKRNINAFPQREATATVLVFSGYLSVS